MRAQPEASTGFPAHFCTASRVVVVGPGARYTRTAIPAPSDALGPLGQLPNGRSTDIYGPSCAVPAYLSRRIVLRVTTRHLVSMGEMQPTLMCKDVDPYPSVFGLI